MDKNYDIKKFDQQELFPQHYDLKKFDLGNYDLENFVP